MKIELDIPDEQYQAIQSILSGTVHPTVEAFCLEQIETGLAIMQSWEDDIDEIK